ncbi:uncharacterized protein LOC109489645 isoform X3 [Ailuropoda melanoleuca]|uniref:uncharacterized protein LOC109489645 isoform X3 n=1 Tax=Ailuropoda melanoleuca TaxID=9646 RepID=UPI001494C752|nr:uncharacterized protein LOC109489645 isoform X3 [Ailuropoda melanoleuca]
MTRLRQRKVDQLSRGHAAPEHRGRDSNRQRRPCGLGEATPSLALPRSQPAATVTQGLSLSNWPKLAGARPAGVTPAVCPTTAPPLSLSSPCPLPGSEEPVHVLDEGAEAPVSSQGWNWLYWDIERIQFSAGLRALVSLLGSQGTRFSTLCTVRASNKRLSRSPTQRTRLGETRWEEAPGPCAQLCIDRVRPRSPPPSVHPNSADPLRQSGTQRAGTLPGPSRTSDGCPQPAEPPVLLASLQPHPCSGVLAPRSGSAGPRSQRAGSGSAPRRVRNP